MFKEIAVLHNRTCLFSFLHTSVVLSVLYTTTYVFGQSISYQGRLTDDSGPVTSDNLDFQFRLWDAPQNGTLLAERAVADVSLEKGLFSTDIAFSPDNFFRWPTWLEVVADGSSLSPRQRIASAPYAHLAFGLTNGYGQSNARGPISTGFLGDLGGYGQIDEDRFGTYLVGQNGNNLALEIGVTDDGVRRAYLRLDNSLQTTGYLGMGVHTGAGDADVREQFRIQRDGAVVVQNNSLFVSNSGAPNGSETWGLVVDDTDGRLTIGPSVA
ncbi:hypothetical protein GF356_09310, partial [candidate division GN15 bacterium]|nr:hypothetical protein [candidate division GN15 bacterium]